VVFVADDLGAWLVGLLADAGRKKLTTLVLGSDQERAVRQAAAAAVQLTARELDRTGGERARQLAMVITEVFGEPVPDGPLTGQATLLEGLQAGIAQKLAPLDDPGLTGTGQSSAELLGVPGAVLAERLAGHLVREVMLRGSRGGPLAPLAGQLNHDVTHLQGQRLEGMLARLAGEVRDGLPRAGSATAVASQPVRLLPRPAFLAGREELLADLEARLTSGDAEGPRIVALCGLGGAGKTSVAVEYAHRHLAGLGVVWQLAAEEPTVLAAGFGVLAAQLGARDLLDAGDPIAQVHAVLAARAGGWLLVFDNAPGPAALQGVLPPAGQGQVLITSQDPHWPGRQAVDVPVLGQDVAAAFLLARAGSLDQGAAGELAAELGGLPLALEQACAYMQAAGRSIAQYLALFRQRRTDLLARGQITGYGKQVATCWSLALDQLQQAAVQAVGLLRLLACCAPEQIPLDLLLQSRPELAESLNPQVAPLLLPLLEDPVAADGAVAALRQYSLISHPAGGSVSVHRLVQAVTLAQLPADQAEAWRQAARLLTGAALPADPELPGTWPIFAALLPHVQATHPADGHTMERVASFLGDSGNYIAARVLQQQILDARERVLGAEHPSTLTARANLASWTGEAGDAAAARDQFAVLLPVRERASGAEHPDTLAARAKLANWTGEAGDAAAARDQYAALLPVREGVSDAEHPDTLAARAELAYWTGRAGDVAAARDQFAVLLPVREGVSGAEHPDTLAARAELAYWTGRAGDVAAARDQYAVLLPVRERVLGAEHPSTLTARAELACWTGEAGDVAAARDQFAVLLPVSERVLGAEHPDTLADRGDLAYWTGRAGDAATARDQYAALLPVIERVLGAEHPNTLTARANLASWTGRGGDAAAARDQHAVLLPVSERVLGAEHPSTLTARADLASWTGEAGDAAAARDQFAALLPVRERVSGAEHPDTLAARAELANWTKQAHSQVE
jgi:Tetratricopeptide repeat